ncbi:MAG TPA: hypothetical protein VNI61_03200 [Gemmatimonadales bacterium]|nr:hypothetical protein [Gemmatimonadales bacterium]
MLAGLWLLAAPPALAAQSVTVTGRILHGGQDRRPLPGQWAVLHEVRSAGGGALDSGRTDAQGRYRLALRRADTAALYLVSTTHHGVGYFSAPLRVEGRRVAEAEPIVVFDTTLVGPPIRLARRLLTVFRAGEGGGREVLELVEVENPGNRTRIAPDTLHPVWTVLLPTGATGWRAGEGDLSPQAVWRSGDTVKVFAPIWPGGPRQLSYQYFVSGSVMRIPLDQPVTELDLLLEDSTTAPAGAAFDSLGMYEIEGRRFAAYRAGPLAAGGAVTLRFVRSPLRAEQLVPYIAGVAAAALLWGLWVAMKKRPPAASAQSSGSRRA